MNALLALVLSVVLLAGGPAWAAPEAPAVPLKPLQEPKAKPMDPTDLEVLFGPVQRFLGLPDVSQSKSTGVSELASPCKGQAPGSCVVSIRFSAAINEVSVKAFEGLMEAAKRAGAARVMLELTTNGGLVDQGHDMARAIETYPGPVICVADGTVASMGAYVLQACDKRIMTHRAILMIHHVMNSVPENYLNARQLRERAVAADRFTDAYMAQVSHRSHLSADQVKKKTARGDWNLNAPEALKDGFVDGVIPFPPNQFYQMLKDGLVP